MSYALQGNSEFLERGSGIRDRRWGPFGELTTITMREVCIGVRLLCFDGLRGFRMYFFKRNFRRPYNSTDNPRYIHTDGTREEMWGGLELVKKLDEQDAAGYRSLLIRVIPNQ